MTEFLAPPTNRGQHRVELHQHVEDELPLAVQAASRFFHSAKGDLEEARARDQYFQALTAFSNFLFHQQHMAWSRG